jgi:protein-disulfide isomerase
MNDRVEKSSRDDKVNSTPTFVINGQTLNQEATAASIGAAIDAAAKAKAG